jgi:hypothetical protein
MDMKTALAAVEMAFARNPEGIRRRIRALDIPSVCLTVSELRELQETEAILSPLYD